jgi:hypothetical protein
MRDAQLSIVIPVIVTGEPLTAIERSGALRMRTLEKDPALLTRMKGAGLVTPPLPPSWGGENKGE